MYPTLASELIKRLQSLIDLHGDLPITALSGGGYHTARDNCSVDPYYYDGGYLIPLEPPGYACNHWVQSRSIVGTEIPNKFIRIRAGYPCDENDTINGMKIKPTPEENININSYLALVAEFSPKLIRTIEQRESTQQMVDRLIDKPEELNEGEQDYLSLLGSLIDEFECSTIYLEPDDEDSVTVKEVDVNTYLSLVAEFNPRPITSEVQRDATQQMVNKLTHKHDLEPLNQDEHDYLSVLCSLLFLYGNDTID